MEDKISKEVDRKLQALAEGFRATLYEDDVTFLENMKSSNLAGDDISKYRFWEWTQGVGLYGFWQLFQYTGEKSYLDVVEKYYERQMQIGLPGKNVNTVTPLLTMSYLAEYTHNDTYMEVCTEWAEWIMKDLPRTNERGFQHITSDSVNEQELWDDTLFMTVLFLANMGRILQNQDYLEEAQYQFLLHVKYLADKDTGLWYHGWTFLEKSNFAAAKWGRGNCWVTAAIPIFLENAECPKAITRFLKEALRSQAESLKRLQDENGMWHTLIDDSTSYVETSATCGFGFGILKAVQIGILDESYIEVARKALLPVLSYIQEDGVVNQVSYGTPMGRASQDFYKEIPIRPMPYGQALAILFLLQYKIINNTKKD